MVAPLASSKTGSWDSDWPPSPMQQMRFMPPSYVPDTEIVPLGSVNVDEAGSTTFGSV
ncbi:hypothetical protein GCM10009682_12010 [Luedemannella flava]|uniref:Uncharacterized protein n=1 Tax=Luedemannella flava TaxID=349316 RepID=A0ABP4XUI1_9ACTN